MTAPPLILVLVLAFGSLLAWKESVCDETNMCNPPPAWKVTMSAEIVLKTRYVEKEPSDSFRTGTKVT